MGEDIDPELRLPLYTVYTYYTICTIQYTVCTLLDPKPEKNEEMESYHWLMPGVLGGAARSKSPE